MLGMAKEKSTTPKQDNVDKYMNFTQMNPLSDKEALNNFTSQDPIKFLVDKENVVSDIVKYHENAKKMYKSQAAQDIDNHFGSTIKGFDKGTLAEVALNYVPDFNCEGDFGEAVKKIRPYAQKYTTISNNPSEFLSAFVNKADVSEDAKMLVALFKEDYLDIESSKALRGYSSQVFAYGAHKFLTDTLATYKVDDKTLAKSKEYIANLTVSDLQEEGAFEKYRDHVKIVQRPGIRNQILGSTLDQVVAKRFQEAQEAAKK